MKKKYLYFMRDTLDNGREMTIDDKKMVLNKEGWVSDDLGKIYLCYEDFEECWGIKLNKGQQVRINVEKLLELVEDVPSKK